MDTIYVWSVFQTYPSDGDNIDTFDWKCEKITEEGKVAETTGNCNLSTSIAKDIFITFSRDKILDILFENIDKNLIESQTVLKGE
jgi:hypothetical protein